MSENGKVKKLSRMDSIALHPIIVEHWDKAAGRYHDEVTDADIATIAKARGLPAYITASHVAGLRREAKLTFHREPSVAEQLATLHCQVKNLADRIAHLEHPPAEG